MEEAKNSVTYDVTTKNGFKCLFTVRRETLEEMFEVMAEVEKTFLEGGTTPTVRKMGGFTKKPEIKSDGKICPKDGGILTIKTSSKDGKQFYSCANSKYDPITKQRSGCDFFEWVQAEDEGASEKQKEMIKNRWPEEYKETLTKKEANTIISAHMA